MTEIIFEGILSKTDLEFLIFTKTTNGVKTSVEIPIEKPIADRIMKYLGSILPPTPHFVERGNDEPSE